MTMDANADPRAAGIAKIDKEIVRLEALRSEKKQAVEPFCLADTEETIRHREPLNREIEKLERAIASLRDQRFDIQLNGLPAPVASKNIQQQSTRKAWGLDDTLGSEPSYPTGLRRTGDRVGIDAAFDAFVTWHQERKLERLHEAGFHPSATASMMTAGLLTGTLDGLFNWLSHRCAEMEERLAEIEGTGIRYEGAYQRAQAYRRGSVVSSGGSAWVALKDAQEGEQPGSSPDSWQLLVKKGTDGKDKT